MNIGNPGTFETEMNKMLGRNNLPTMIFRNNPASGSVLHASRLTNPDAPQERDNAEEKGAVEQTPAATVHETNEADKAKLQMIKTSTQSTVERQDLQNTIQRETGAVRKKVTTATMDTQAEETLQTLEYADDCELQIHWCDKILVPSECKTMPDIMQPITKKELKWTYSNDKYSEALVKDYLIN
ncbi:hypothetical protein Hamer_G005191 [Homarus americanus]|uniref:Uncharacterized protein n=1 Tax=Homarus americanus TaxID=6706 RepID=A0A8J5JVB5_HOMAM|nr:hypothetical protein Hamer_G005191 [Homarus americanus]